MKKILLVACLMLSMSACSIFSSSTSTAEGDVADSAAIGRYWDFDDVLVPSTMKLEKDKSMIFNSDGYKGGLLVFNDNVELNSLVNFFMISMTKDNWLHKASFKYPNVAMFFAKQDRTCIIQISESSFSTTVSIWVAPTVAKP